MLLTQEDLERCKVFAEAVYSSNEAQYKRRNQSNPDKIKHQIVVGKLGELAVSRILRTTAEPDFTIYLDKKQKSFDSDLVFEKDGTKYQVHVKTQEVDAADKYGLSWTFQYGGSGYGHTDPLIIKPKDNDIVAMLKVDVNSLNCELCYLIDAKELPLLLKLPKLPQLYNIKRVVYASDITPEVCLRTKVLL